MGSNRFYGKIKKLGLLFLSQKNDRQKLTELLCFVSKNVISV